MADAKLVTFVSKTKEQFKVSKKAACRSEVVKRLFEDLGESVENEPVPIDASSDILKLVIEWLDKHQDDPAPKKDATVEMTEWDRTFIKRDLETIFDIISAANFMQIQELTDMCCKSVADLIKGKSVEEMRKIFGIKNDFTPAEEEQLRQEHAWCEE